MLHYLGTENFFTAAAIFASREEIILSSTHPHRKQPKMASQFGSGRCSATSRRRPTGTQPHLSILDVLMAGRRPKPFGRR